MFCQAPSNPRHGKAKKETNDMKITISNKGFSLVEFLIIMAITGVFMGAVSSTFYTQQKSAVTQEQVADMQQNIRGAMHFLEMEIRMAGYDPTGDSEAGIKTAGTGSTRITMDIHDSIDNDGDGQIDEDDERGNSDGYTDDGNEDITYSHYDYDGDGTADSIGRDTGSGEALLAQNIDALNFVYLDENGATAPTLADIRSVQISIVAKAGRIDQGYTNNTVYTNQIGDPIYTAPGDSYRRRLLSTHIKCRNLGL